MIKDIQAIDGSLQVQFDMARGVYTNLVDFGYMHEIDGLELPWTEPDTSGHTMRTDEVPTNPLANNGPQWLTAGWKHGYKMWVGDLPRCIQKSQIAQIIGTGWTDIACQNSRSQSGVAYSVITFSDLSIAIKAYRTMAQAKFDHGNGVIEHPVVRWWRKREGSSGQDFGPQP